MEIANPRSDTTRDAPTAIDDTSHEPRSPRRLAIADGPLDPIDTGGFPLLPLLAIGLASIAVLAGAWRLLRRHPAST